MFSSEPCLYSVTTVVCLTGNKFATAVSEHNFLTDTSTKYQKLSRLTHFNTFITNLFFFF